MNEWKYTGKLTNGLLIRGTLKANNEGEVFSKLIDMDINCISIIDSNGIEKFFLENKVGGTLSNSSSKEGNHSSEEGNNILGFSGNKKDTKLEEDFPMSQSGKNSIIGTIKDLSNISPDIGFYKKNRTEESLLESKRTESLLYGEAEEVCSKSGFLLDKKRGIVKFVKLANDPKGKIMVLLVVEHDEKGADNA